MHNIRITFILLFSILVSCQNNSINKHQLQKKKTAAIINNKEITLNEIDSMVSSQIYEIRMKALEIMVSRNILESEADNQNVSLKKLVEENINNKSESVTNEDFNNYIKELNITHVDTNKILNYLTIINRKKRQVSYIDSLKNIYPLKIFFHPSFFRKVDMSNIYSYNLNDNNSKFKVYIISDFKCPACQQAEQTLKNIYQKYNNQINFKFIYFSDYVDKDALACDASAKQNKFKEMHDIVFNNTNFISQDSVYYKFAKKLRLNYDKFKKDMHDNDALKNLLKTKKQLISKQIYSTPTFVVKGKVLDDKYAINYLEEVINEELNNIE